MVANYILKTMPKIRYFQHQELCCIKQLLFQSVILGSEAALREL